MVSGPLVSIVVPTKNSAEFLDACLQSIREQTYPHIELIVVDNHSTDATQKIARKYTDKVYIQGPERSAQRNYGASKTRGEFVAFIDSDMQLTSGVVDACVNASLDKNIGGVIIPEESFGEGFWAKCKRLERSFYVGVNWIEAARFFRKDIFEAAGGYAQDLISGEDWDLNQRVNQQTKLNRVTEFIQHNEGKITLLNTILTKYQYAQQFSKYIKRNKTHEAVHKQTCVMSRFWLYFRQPGKLIQNPVVGIGMLFMKVCEFGFGGMGLLSGRIAYKRLK